MPDPPWADYNAGPTQALLSPGQQPGEMVAVFTDKCHSGAAACAGLQELTQSVALIVAAQGAGK